MTENDLSTLVDEHVSRTEPPFGLSAEHAILLGRRTLRRRRARRGATALVGIAAAALIVPLVISNAPAGDRGTDHGLEPATADALERYDAAEMPALLDATVRPVLSRSVPDLGAEKFTAEDGQDNELLPRYYDKASGMQIAYGGTGDHQLRVRLAHSRSEAEGGARKNCRRDLAEGIALRCTISTAANGDVVETRIMAVRHLSEGFPRGTWGVVTREELRTGTPVEGSPNQAPIDPDGLYFKRTVGSVHSESYLTAAEEIVRAPDLKTSLERFRVPVADLTSIVTDRALVIPEPPLGKGGCPWTVPGVNVTCTK